MDNTFDGFRPRPGYKRTKQRKGKCFPWDDDPRMRTVKIAARLILEQIIDATRAALERNFAKQGGKDRVVYNRIVPMFPWAGAYYEAHCDFKFTPKTLGNRNHKGYIAYDENGQPIPGISHEHPLNNPKLRPYIEAVTALVIRGTPVTEEEAIVAGGGSPLFAEKVVSK